MAENGHSLTTLGILDFEASVTLVTRSVAQKLGFQGTPEVISVNTALAKGQYQNVTVFGCNLSPIGVADPKIPVRRAHIVNDRCSLQAKHPGSLGMMSPGKVRFVD